MSKRKELSKTKAGAEIGSESEDSKSDNEEIVNVDFDYFDLRPDVDFHAIRNLLRQTFDSDNTIFDLSGLADLILSQSTLGSTVKTDGVESDPFAFLTVVNANVHRENPAIRQITNYILSKTKANEAFNKKLNELLADDAKSNTGIIFSERLINMPTEVAPPMYRMLYDEIQRAINTAEQYQFDYYIIISKSFTEIASRIDEEDERPKKKKKNREANRSETFYFHAEDEIIQRKSEHHMTYKFSNEAQVADSRRTFQDYGISPQGQLLLISSNNFKEIIDEMLTLFAVPPQE
ncbi:p21-C-terminal region-binding protein-domain-containing protein [Lipomyces tetrasporus]|uniref:Protein BCP1 n=1 Tax=Lipomyces tetrasporus TaxID=54092 RepID=A0AAD7VVK7_9ASCO|nr:p21-C-terminal region-binding protein-domain-containing protein [Lipomyces tetrasporus]KAJ8103106.1 p21-C-terminal region-binding protein-domain-containing protein [Lipomyces tetrasporus]